MRLASARRSSSKMASEGASGEQASPGQSLAAAVLASVDTKCEFNMDNLSKPELLTLLSIMEGELEARDLVIEALRAQRKEVFLQERYGHYSLRDPFLALQRDVQCSVSGDKERRVLGSSPMSVLEAVMNHCRKMQERMSAQLAAAESRQKRLEMEKLQLQSLEQDHRKLTAQLKDEREKNKHIVMMLVRECKQLATRVVEESQRFDELQSRLDEESRASGRLQEDLNSERQRSQQMEAKMEKQLSEFDTEREQLRAKLSREETENQNLRQQIEQLRTGQNDGKEANVAPKTTESSSVESESRKTKVVKASVSVGTEPVLSRTISCQTDSEVEAPKKSPLSIPVKPTASNYVGLSLPKSRVGSENGSESQTSQHGAGLPSGVSPRVQAARYKFQEQDQSQNGSQSSPPARDLSPTNRDNNFAAKQQARHTVTQVLSRFTSPPAGSTGPLRPGLPHSASESGPFPGRLSHPIGIKSPTVARIDRGNPPPIPPKKPGLSQTPSPPVKGVGDGGRTSGVGPGLKPVTPQLPPKPALDLVPALAASQTQTTIAACAIAPPSPPTSISLLAAASGWCPSVERGAGGDGSAALDLGPLLQHAALQGNVTLMSMLLNRPPDSDLSSSSSSSNHVSSSRFPFDDTSDQDSTEDLQTSALFAAAQNGHTDCVKLLLASSSADVSDENGFTALHFAAAHGHPSCVEALLSSAAPVNALSSEGHSPLFVACEFGQLHCARILLDAGADRSLSTTDGCSPLHAAVRSGNLDLLRLLLYYVPQSDSWVTSDTCDLQSDPWVTSDPPAPVVSSELLNQTNSDGWTAAHVAAARGLKESLEALCSHSEHNLEAKDKWSRTLHDLATDDCKNLLENLNSYCVRVVLLCSAALVSLGLESGLTRSNPAPRWDLGSVRVDRSTSWSQLWSDVAQAFTTHLQTLCEGPDQVQDRPLGLSLNSVASFSLGDTEWVFGEEPSGSPWDLVRKPPSQSIRLRLKGLSESCLDEVALVSLIPLPLLNNYVRLVEQYGNLMLHGVDGSLQEFIAAVVAHCIKLKQEALGLHCDVARVEVDQSLSREQLLDAFIKSGFLVPVGSEVSSSHRVVVVVERLEKASSLSALMGDICHSLDQRGPQSTVNLSSGPHWFVEGSFLITTLSKPRLQGSELRLQQHLRWVTLRWDQEPLQGMLGRHLRRQLFQQVGEGSHDSLLWRSASWVMQVWQQLNSCLSRLGTNDALLGPQSFLSCPLSTTQDIIRWLSALWNSVVVPRVEEAIVSRVTSRRSSSCCSPSPSDCLCPSPSDRQLSTGQQAVVKAALSILLNRAVLQGCPLSRLEMERFLPDFSGGSFPLSALASFKGATDGGRGGRGGGRRRESGKLRRSNTSPRKRGGPGTGWSSGGSFRGAGSQSSSDVRFISNGKVQREGLGLALFSDDDTDLIRELQTMCSSKSEPDISKISQTKDLFSSEGQDSSEQQQTPTSPLSPSTSASRCKSQLPVPTSKGPQQHLRPATSTTAPPTCNNNNSINNNHLPNQGRTSSKPKPRSTEDIWILHEK